MGLLFCSLYFLCLLCFFVAYFLVFLTVVVSSHAFDTHVEVCYVQ